MLCGTWSRTTGTVSWASWGAFWSVVYTEISSFPSHNYSVTKQTSAAGGYLSAFWFSFSLTSLHSLLRCYLLKPRVGSRGAVMIKCRSPAEEFHSLRRQSFQSLKAMGLPPQRSPLS